MELEKIFLVLPIVTAFLLAYGIFCGTPALAAPTGASVTVGEQETAPESTAGTVTTEGGNVTAVNVSAYQVTGKWAGFWGTVSGDIRLADSTGNVFYKWTISDPTGGVVYACTGTVSDWSSSNIQPLYASDGYLPAFMLEGTDSFNNTFTQQGTFDSPSLSISQVNYTYTYQGGNPGSDFATYALRTSDGSVLIWAGKIKAGASTFNGNTGDYQILAGVTSESTPTTFYFYLELP